MILIWGSTFYGKTDEVPGLYYVTTRFGHLWYLPLIPLGSYLILAGSDDKQGVEIPFSGKSMLLGWGRAGTFLAGVISAIVWLTSPKGVIPWIPAALSVASIAGFTVLTFGKMFRRASYERALQLGKHVGLNRRGQIMIDLHFGRVSDVEARGLMQTAEADEIADQEQELARRKQALQQRGALPPPSRPTHALGGGAKPMALCLSCGSDFALSKDPWTAAGFCSTQCQGTK
jgi:hypothetical protein